MGTSLLFMRLHEIRRAELLVLSEDPPRSCSQPNSVFRSTPFSLLPVEETLISLKQWSIGTEERHPIQQIRDNRPLLHSRGSQAHGKWGAKGQNVSTSSFSQVLITNTTTLELRKWLVSVWRLDVHIRRRRLSEYHENFLSKSLTATQVFSAFWKLVRPALLSNLPAATPVPASQQFASFPHFDFISIPP
jgi:hypothetical protein